MHPRHTPFLRLLLPWLAGILAGATASRPLPGLEAGLLAGVAGMILLVKRRYAYRFRWVFGSGVFVLLLGFGYRHAVQHDERQRADHFSRVCPAPGVLLGLISDAPAKGGKIKVRLRLEAAGVRADSLRPCSGNVLLFMEPGPATGRLQYGDRLLVQANVRPAEPPKNPNAFDYRRYLHAQNIHYQAYVNDQSYRVTATGLGHPLWRMAFRWRDRLLGVLRAHFPTTDEYAVASALLVGYKDELSEDLRAAYAETGSMHALAVSGTHVGLLYAGLMFLLRRIPWPLRVRRWADTGVSLLAIWAFALVTGATASVLRAALMFSAYLVGKAFRRQASIWNILGASAFGLLLLDPYMLYDAGFQLSYAAVAGIVFFYPHFKKRTPAPPKWAAEVWSVLLIGVAAQLGTLPLSLYYFHQFPVYFWLSGWVVVLGGAVFLWGGAVLAVLSALAPGPAVWLGKALYGLVWGMNYLIQVIRQLPGSVISGIWISAPFAVLLCAFIGATAGAWLLYRSRWLLTALALLTVLGFGRAVQVAGWLHQRQVTLYHANRQFLLDFFDGEQLVVYSGAIGARQEQFAAQANRWAHGLRHPVRLDSAAVYTGANLFIRPPFVRFYDKTLVLIDPAFRVPPAAVSPVEVDVLILHGNPDVHLTQCLRMFPSRLVVFGVANSPKRVARWKHECKEQGIPFYDVQEQGAWEMVIGH